MLLIVNILLYYILVSSLITQKITIPGQFVLFLVFFVNNYVTFVISTEFNYFSVIADSKASTAVTL